MKILIIDDDKDLLQITARRFGRKGFQTYLASTLVQANELFSENKDFTAIICDLFLANGENGLEFYEQSIKNYFKGHFILATGDMKADKKIQLYAQENSHFLCVEKPYSFDEVLEKIKPQ